jgi:phenylacetyl-CoA:acceptor oxidoreductase 26-kDa subunit
MQAEPSHQKPWDWRAGIQFICGGTGTGLLFFTAVAALFEPAWLLPAGLPALLIIGTGLFSVWIKLGRRWRFFLVILNPRTSWMAREAWLSAPLLGLLLLALLWGSPTLALVAALFGLAFLYAQARILQTARGIPVWREPLIVPLIVLTGLVEGGALLLVATVVFIPIYWLIPALLLLTSLRLVAWLSYRHKLTRPGAAPLASIDVLNGIRPAVTWGGHALPVALLLIALLFPATALPAGAIAAIAAAAGGWYLKFTLITRAAYNQGAALSRTPARTPGHAGLGTRPGWE